jgi:hypothetical protein
MSRCLVNWPYWPYGLKWKLLQLQNEWEGQGGSLTPKRNDDIGYQMTPAVVPRIETTESFQTLGVYISPSGSQKQQFKILRNHAKSYYHNVKASTLTPSEAYIVYFQYLRPKLNSPLPCCTFTPSMCRAIQAPALATLLPKLWLQLGILIMQ